MIVVISSNANVVGSTPTVRISFFVLTFTFPHDTCTKYLIPIDNFHGSFIDFCSYDVVTMLPLAPEANQSEYTQREIM